MPAIQPRAPAGDAVRLVPVPDIDEHHDAEQCRTREPRTLDWPRGSTMKAAAAGPPRTKVTANLEHRLRESVLAAGGHARHA